MGHELIHGFDDQGIHVYTSSIDMYPCKPVDL